MAVLVPDTGARPATRRGAQDGVVTDIERRPTGLAGLLRRPAAAGLVLLLCYVALSFLNDPGGYLGTDTGGKVATLEAMSRRGDLDPDIGYWAERWDPDGSLHPLWYTSHIDGRWVNVTTLPMLYAAVPLYEVGGYRAALLLPMLGAVGAAFAARALARRVREGSGWPAFWLAGLASPIAVYALDFWEHTVGVALVAWAVVWLVRLADGERPVAHAALAGLALGVAATMRTEALVYAAAAGAVTAVVVLHRRRGRALLPFVGAGAALVGAMAVPLALNTLLERAVLGSGLRAGRAAGTAADAGGEAASRLQEGMLTGTGLHATLEARSYVVGLLLLVLLVIVAVRALPHRHDGPLTVAAAAGAVVLYLLRAGDGLGFVPGMVAATPIVAVALARGWRHPPARPLVAVAVVALPVVWAFQFTGGAGPQWAGRYVLPSGLVLAAVGAACLPSLARWAQTLFVGLAVAVTAFGVGWLSERSHDVADASAALAARPEPVVVSDIAHLAREGGVHNGERRWLTAVGAAAIDEAAGVVRRAGFDELAFVTLETGGPDRVVPGFRPGDRTTVELVDDVPLRVTTYRAVP